MWKKPRVKPIHNPQEMIKQVTKERKEEESKKKKKEKRKRDGDFGPAGTAPAAASWALSVYDEKASQKKGSMYFVLYIGRVYR